MTAGRQDAVDVGSRPCCHCAARTALGLSLAARANIGTMRVLAAAMSE